jgi:hypothetical protein
MRVAVYDRKPGAGVAQWFLSLSWRIGCFLHKLFGLLDDYHGAASWDEAIGWLLRRPALLSSIQYWGHGSPATVWLAGKPAGSDVFLKLKPKVIITSIVWLRVCSAFQGRAGQTFATRLAEGLGCTIAGHTRIIGVLQGGLHTVRPGTAPCWPESEAGESVSFCSRNGLRLGNNTVICLRATVPDGW